jgi:hypothetical protein
MSLRNKVIKNLEDNKIIKIDTCCACVLSLGDINRKLSSELPLEKLDTVCEKLNEIKKILNIF